jgi:hypothetical protein
LLATTYSAPSNHDIADGGYPSAPIRRPPLANRLDLWLTEFVARQQLMTAQNDKWSGEAL